MANTIHITHQYQVLVYSNGDRRWYLDDLLHREDGPAFEFASGTKHYFLKGRRHRENGPAIEAASGVKKWYLGGVQYTEENWKVAVAKYSDS